VPKQIVNHPRQHQIVIEERGFYCFCIAMTVLSLRKLGFINLNSDWRKFSCPDDAFVLFYVHKSEASLQAQLIANAGESWRKTGSSCIVLIG
jgi:predicted flavoprotein YhiN